MSFHISPPQWTNFKYLKSRLAYKSSNCWERDFLKIFYIDLGENWPFVINQNVFDMVSLCVACGCDLCYAYQVTRYVYHVHSSAFS